MLLLGAGGAWLWQANAYEKQLIELGADYDKQLADKAEQHGKEREAAATAVIEQLQLQQAQRRALEDRLQAQDKTTSRKCKMLKMIGLACVTGWLLLMRGCQSFSSVSDPAAWWMAPREPSLTAHMLNELSPLPATAATD